MTPAADWLCARGRVCWAGSGGWRAQRPCRAEGLEPGDLLGSSGGAAAPLPGAVAPWPCEVRLQRRRRRGEDPLVQLCSAAEKSVGTQWDSDAGRRCGWPAVAFIWRKDELSLGVAPQSALQRRGRQLLVRGPPGRIRLPVMTHSGPADIPEL
ncbi:hypothetical protein NDU88_005942 [Pleurodeles waltl]|uniref:Uncharacterized protein n=1 Tax=Pleurodeles waltl TaxID=8319 RepID=A0AAV7PP56_PLEWA|nr:hypothetical protein NDU88_005942 [Pleurodeles waltl]